MLCGCVYLYNFSTWFEAEITPVQGFKKWLPSTPEAAALPAMLSSSCCPHLWIRVSWPCLGWGKQVGLCCAWLCDTGKAGAELLCLLLMEQQGSARSCIKDMARLLCPPQPSHCLGTLPVSCQIS